MALPTSKTAPVKDLSSQTILIYGPPGIGKSTLASSFDNALFLATEAGLNHLEVYQKPVPTWETFLNDCKDIAKGNHQYSTIVIDTIDNLHRFCRDYIRNKHGFAHEQDLSFGKGYDLTKDEFLRTLTKLSLLPYGLVFISHAEFVEIKTRTATITKAVPTLQRNARQIIVTMCDVILYCESITTDNGEARIMRTKPSENWEAKDRSGMLPVTLPLDYQAFYNAFYGIKNEEEK